MRGYRRKIHKKYHGYADPNPSSQCGDKILNIYCRIFGLLDAMQKILYIVSAHYNITPIITIIITIITVDIYRFLHLVKMTPLILYIAYI